MAVIPEASFAARPGVVVMVANALDPMRGRALHPVERPVTMRAWLDAQGIGEFDRPTIGLHNGRAVLRADWPNTTIARGDVCSFVALPGNPGGGGGKKNPLRVILSIAVMVAGAYAGEMAAGWFSDTVLMGGAAGPLTAGQALTAKIFGGVVSGVVGVAGSALVNALVPASKATLPGGASGYNVPSASATYSISGQGNTARLGAVIPKQYGYHKFYPDLIAAPWTEYADNEQYLFQPHCLGLGLWDIDSIKVANTAIGNFAEIEYEILEPGETATLFDPNVVTAAEVSGQTMEAPNELDTGEDGILGPFTAAPPETTTHHIGVDMVLSRGLYYANDSGGLDSRTIAWTVQARPIDVDGAPTGDGSWTTLGSESITDATTTPIRRSYKYAVADGRYEAQAWRTDTKDTSSRAGHEIAWTALRSYVDGPDSWDDVTILLVKARATNNLSSQTSRQINVTGTAKIPVWDAGTQTWSAPVASRSIVWAAADAARASYGGRLDDSRLPLADYAALDAVLEARDDHFDARFDAKTTVWDALTRIAKCGRAVPYQQGGIVRLFRAAPQTLPTAVYGPRNIVKGSFSIQYLLPSDDTADAVTVKYWSKVTWDEREVTAAMADSTAESPAEVTLFGSIDRDHASREGEAMAAANRYHRRFPKFRTGMEGLIPTYGDLIGVTHDLPRWGQGGEVTAWESTGNAGSTASPSWEDVVLVLSEPLEWTDGATHYIGLRKRDGSLAGPFACVAGSADDRVALSEPMTMTPYVGGDEERTHASFGPGDTWTRLCRVLAVRPRSGGEQVEIHAVVDDDRAYPN